MTKTDGKLDRIRDGYILAGKSIREVGKYTEEVGRRIIHEFGSNLKVLGNPRDVIRLMDLEMQNGVIIPGFVKGHGHDHESVLIGLARDVPLTTWLDEAINIFTGFLHENQDSLKHELGKSPYYVAYIKARLDDISFGITSAMTHHCNFNKYHVDELVAANENAGSRIFIAVGSQDRHYDSRILDTPEEAIERMNLLDSKHGHLERTKIIPGPDQLFSNGPELLKALKKWANERDKLIHIHSSEEPATTRWFTEEYGMTPIEYAESIEFLDEKTLLAHQVNNTEHDLDLIQNLGAMVVHNPLANTILGSGMPPVLEMIKRDIPICFSTDGSGSADNQNMLSAARLASQYQKAFHQDATVLDAEEALERITSHPARMLRLNAGILDVGKDSDFLMFDLSKPNVTPTRLETVVENLIWASAGNEIKHVVANGQVLVENYEYKTLDLNQVLTDVQKLADLFEIFKADIKTKSETGVRSS
jgi:5-methylthioadenosine/S-adenosylhomocysteine deaminase